MTTIPMPPSLINTQIVTTGAERLTVGSSYIFELQAKKNGIPWDLTGGSVTLNFTDPKFVATSVGASISGSTATANWSAPDNVGEWLRSWSISAGGITQNSDGIAFLVTKMPVPTIVNVP